MFSFETSLCVSTKVCRCPSPPTTFNLNESCDIAIVTEDDDCRSRRERFNLNCADGLCEAIHNTGGVARNVEGRHCGHAGCLKRDLGHEVAIGFWTCVPASSTRDDMVQLKTLTWGKQTNNLETATAIANTNINTDPQNLKLQRLECKTT